MAVGMSAAEKDEFLPDPISSAAAAELRMIDIDPRTLVNETRILQYAGRSLVTAVERRLSRCELSDARAQHPDCRDSWR